LSIDRGETKTEVERLRARVEALESELIELQAWANDAVAEAQDRTYWLDRWHVDLNELMRRRSADRIRAAARAVRGIYRAFLRMKGP
jgi:hypothetical protein